MDDKIIIDNLWLEIKKLKRMDFRLFSSFKTIVDILNERERDELLNAQVYHIMKEIDYDDNFELFNKIYEDITKLRGIVLFLKGQIREIKSDYINIKNENYELKERVNYLDDELKKIKEKLYNKCFVYTDSEETEDEHDYIDKITNSL